MKILFGDKKHGTMRTGKYSFEPNIAIFTPEEFSTFRFWGAMFETLFFGYITTKVNKSRHTKRQWDNCTKKFKFLFGSKRKGVMRDNGFAVVNKSVVIDPEEYSMFRMWGIVFEHRFFGVMTKFRDMAIFVLSNQA